MNTPNFMPEAPLDSAEQKQHCVALYQLSQHPGFPALVKVITDVAADYRVQAPLKEEDKVAWETFGVVRFAIETALHKLGSDIEIGARLTQLEQAGEDPDGKEDRHNRERKRA